VAVASSLRLSEPRDSQAVRVIAVWSEGLACGVCLYGQVGARQFRQSYAVRDRETVADCCHETGSQRQQGEQRCLEEWYRSGLPDQTSLLGTFDASSSWHQDPSSRSIR